MKTIEKWIIVVLSVIAVASIGTALYFGIELQDNKLEINNEESKENDDKDNYLYDITYALMNEGKYSLEKLEVLFGEEVYGEKFIKDINK